MNEALIFCRVALIRANEFETSFILSAKIVQASEPSVAVTIAVVVAVVLIIFIS